MRLRLWLGVGVAAVAAVAAVTAGGAFGISSGAIITTFADTGRAGSFTLAGSSTASSRCSKATALQVGKPYFYDSKNTLTQVLCGSFTGPGSDAMAIAFFFPVCWPVQRWAVFRFTNGDWKLVLDEPVYLSTPLVAVGSDIRETTAIHRQGDSRCNPTGGTHARLWHWNGTRLVAGPWKVISTGTQAKTLHLIQFRSPTGNLACEFGGGGVLGVSCVSVKPAHFVRLSPNGKVFICQTYGDRCLFSTKIFENGGRIAAAPVLGYGQQDTHAGFVCDSEKSGITCTVIAGTAKGKGFLINTAGVTRVGA